MAVKKATKKARAVKKATKKARDRRARMKQIKAVETDNPLDVQIGGDHYKSLKIQPIEYIHANKLDFTQGSVVKYITRFRQKGGVEDLKKVIHHVELLIKAEYNEEDF